MAYLANDTKRNSFANPSHVRDSLPPDSQRATLPPVTKHREALVSTGSPLDEAALEAAAARLARTSYSSIEPEDATAIMPLSAFFGIDVRKPACPSIDFSMSALQGHTVTQWPHDTQLDS